MVARGVFKETTRSRPQPMEPEASPGGVRRAGGAGRATGAGGDSPSVPLSGAQKKFIQEAMDQYLKPYMRT